MSLNLSTLLDVTLSLVFVFFTLSMFVSGIVEFINALLEQRSKLLQLALLKVLERPAIAEQYKTIIKTVRQHENRLDTAFEKFWNHPLVRVKRQEYFGLKPISYLSADSFSTVILDLLAKAVPPGLVTNDKHDEQVLDRIRRAVADPNADPTLATLKEIVEPLLQKANTLADFKKSLETWYDGYMEQVSGWFKRYAQAVVWGVSVVVTVFLNIDTLHVTNELFTNKTLRDNLVAQAEQTARQQTKDDLFVRDTIRRDLANVQIISQIRRIPKDTLFIAYAEMRDSVLTDSLRSGARLTGLDSLRTQELYLDYLHGKVDALGLPIGWPVPPVAVNATPPQKACLWLKRLLGWILTATALSFGAPFWFDLLLKIVNIRNVTRKPISSVVPN